MAEPWLQGFSLALLLVAWTFPANEYTYSTGIDPPLSWAYNHFASEGFQTGRHILFPHGPLAFFTYPLYQNIITSILISSLLKVILLFNLYFLLPLPKSGQRWIVAFLAAYVMLIFAGFHHLLIGCIILFYLNYYQHGKDAYKYAGFALVAFAFFVRSYTAVIGGILTFSFIAYYLFRNRRWRTALTDAMLVVAGIVLIWVLLYGGPGGLPRFFLGTYHLAQDNSSAVALYPDNNWLWISVVFVALAGLVLLDRSRRAGYFWVLAGLVLFANWKHGMAREDIFHVRGLFNFLVLTSVLYLYFLPGKSAWKLILAGVALTAFSLNLPNALQYAPARYALSGIDNLTAFLSDPGGIRKSAQENSRAAIASNRLSEEMRAAIGDAEVDIYPWDLSVIPANELNWKPRVVIQSYAAYTPWLDEQNAKHFRSKAAPRFILWELQKLTPDLNGGMLSSIDQRYLLNDEPRALETMMRQYRFLMQDERFLLLERRAAPVSLQHRELGSIKAAWGQWIPLPQFGTTQLRTRVHIPKTLMRRLKSFLYKDEQFWIYLGLNDGSVHKYRIVPGNAADGLWITPYLTRTGEQRQVERILFRASGQHLMADSIEIRWETVGWPEGSGEISSFFGPAKENADSLLLQTRLEPGEPITLNWTGGEQYFSDDAGMDGSPGIRLPGGAFSPAFSLSLDSLNTDELRIQAEGWVKATDYRGRGKVMLVISVDGPEGNILWKGSSIDEQLIDRRHWNHIISVVDFRKVAPGAKLSVFFWNTGEEEVMIDELGVSMWERK